ncbi:prepilin-type N-terminal cleavage/methylation domain-containing protein [Sulfuricurvum kujiense]|nr:prepilin-type N-terminal cleavage/methylation domain-containing protein [Sulfuricurvum kujiense]
MTDIMYNSHKRGFSLIETMVAVALVAIAALALLNVVSNASKISQNALDRFDASMMMGLLAESADDTMDGQTVYVSDFLRERYTIDNSDILESLEPYRINVRTMDKEYLDPLMMMDVSGAAAAHSLAVQNIRFEIGNDKKSCFGISSGTFQ